MTLHTELDTYLTQRRSMGYQLTTAEYLLRQFCDWLAERSKSDSFTIEDAVAWARDRPQASPVWSAQRLTAVRPFAAWLNARTGDISCIPAGLLPARTTRREPYIYTQHDLDQMLTACPQHFSNQRVADTMATIIGLLAATGLRIGEALRLRVADLDIQAHVLTVHATKHPLDRVVPLHPTTTTALIDYLTSPARLATCPAADGPIFVNQRGTAFVSATIEQHFRSLTTAIGLRHDGRPPPRLHDLRHTFATRHMIAAYRAGTDPARTLGLLATWLGHTGIEHTYWYLSAAPELLTAAARRLEPTPQSAERNPS
ncbi:tyrosine-type recombinase/integrase [Corynebacterium variabile]|uniref:tyrosine-type recombinase/integrase n=1 Tax=Corynebacterium variabile TaxID=1727 RepID=UPI003FD1EE1C